MIPYPISSLMCLQPGIFVRVCPIFSLDQSGSASEHHTTLMERVAGEGTPHLVACLIARPMWSRCRGVPFCSTGPWSCLFYSHRNALHSQSLQGTHGMRVAHIGPMLFRGCLLVEFLYVGWCSHSEREDSVAPCVRDMC